MQHAEYFLRLSTRNNAGKKLKKRRATDTQPCSPPGHGFPCLFVLFCQKCNVRFACPLNDIAANNDRHEAALDANWNRLRFVVGARRSADVSCSLLSMSSASECKL